MSGFIICCDCGDTPRYSVETYKIMGKTSKIPQVFTSDKAYLALRELPRGSNVFKFVETLMRGKGKYSFYLEYDDDGNVMRHWDLLKADKLIDKGEGKC